MMIIRRAAIACSLVTVTGLTAHLLTSHSEKAYAQPTFLHGCDSRTPIRTLPANITTPGSYVLTRNLVGVPGQDGITISANNVSLDLNGFSLLGVPGSLNGIVSSGVLVGLSLKNGAVGGWGANGIDVSQIVSCHLEGVRADANGLAGIKAGPNSILTRCSARASGQVSSTDGKGFVLGNGSALSSCTSILNFAAGYESQFGCVFQSCVSVQNPTGFSALHGGTVYDACTARSNTIGFQGQDALIFSACSAEGNQIGFDVANSSIQSCNASSNGDIGFRAASSLLNASLAVGNFNVDLDLVNTLKFDSTGCSTCQ